MSKIDDARSRFEALEAAESAERTGRAQPWERQSGESAKAFAAFVKYRDLAEKRTLARVAQLSQCSAQNIARWSRRHGWVHRTYMYDAMQEEQFREQTARDRIAHRRRQIAIGQSLQTVAISALREWQARLEQKLPLGLAPEQIALLLRLGDDLESKGLGEGEGGNRFTKITLNISKYPDEQAYEDVLKTGAVGGSGPPAILEGDQSPFN